VYSALITFKEKREGGHLVLVISVPRRVFTYLRAARPEDVRLAFEHCELEGKPVEVTISAKDFARLLEKKKC
jgi:hypothetical protein